MLKKEKRKFDTIAEGEQKGLKPTTTDAATLIPDYHERVSNLIAKNNLGESLASSYMNDGAPMAAPGKLFPGYTRAGDTYVEPSEVARPESSRRATSSASCCEVWHASTRRNEDRQASADGRGARPRGGEQVACEV